MKDLNMSAINSQSFQTEPTDSSSPFITPAAAFSHLMSNPLDPQQCIDVFQYQFDTLSIQSYLGFMAKVFSEALDQEILSFQKDPDKPLHLLDQASLFAGELMCHKGNLYHWAAEKFDYEIPEWRCFCEEDHLSTQGAEGGMGHE